MIQSENFDLVLLDIMMPELGDYAVLEQLKADHMLRHIPVIMISALDEIDSVMWCVEMGAENYLLKPFDPVLLRAKIDAYLEKKRLRDQEVLYLQLSLLSLQQRQLSMPEPSILKALRTSPCALTTLGASKGLPTYGP